VRDYANFCQMHVDGGQFKGRRLLKSEPLQLVFTDQLDGAEGIDQFGLGFRIEDVQLGSGAGKRQATGYHWGGYASTHFVVVPDGRGRERERSGNMLVGIMNRPRTNCNVFGENELSPRDGVQGLLWRRRPLHFQLWTACPNTFHPMKINAIEIEPHYCTSVSLNDLQLDITIPLHAVLGLWSRIGTLVALTQLNPRQQ